MSRCIHFYYNKNEICIQLSTSNVTMAVNIRQICDDTKILYVMLVHCRTWKYIEWNGPESDYYKTITKWCNINKDLKVFGNPADGVLLTNNGIVYDVKSGSFVNLDDMDYVTFDFSHYIPNGLAVQVPENDLYVPENVFPEELLFLLQAGGIGSRITVPADMVKL